MKRQKITKIIELKEFTKEQLEIEVRRVRNELDIENMKLSSIKGLLDKVVAEFNSRDEGSLRSGMELEYFYSYSAHLNYQIKLQEVTVGKKSAELDGKHKEMMEVYKEKRILEALYDRILSKETREKLVLEQKEVDFNFGSRKSRE